MENWPAVARDLRRNGNDFLSSFFETSVTQGALWGLGMSFVLGLSKAEVLVPATAFGAIMGTVAAFQLMRVEARIPVELASRTEFSEELRSALVEKSYYLVDAKDGYERYEQLGGFKDLSIGPVKVSSSPPIICTFAGSDAIVSGPVGVLKALGPQAAQ